MFSCERSWNIEAIMFIVRGEVVTGSLTVESEIWRELCGEDRSGSLSFRRR
jgi:hypothetical protein